MKPGNILRDGARSTRERTQPCACVGTRCPACQEDRSRGGEIDSRGDAEGCGHATLGEYLCRESAPSMRFVGSPTAGQGSSERNQRFATHLMSSPPIFRESPRPPPGKGLEAIAESTRETSLSRICRVGSDCDMSLLTTIIAGERERIKASRNTLEFPRAHNAL